MPNYHDFLIIGAGIFGTTAAIELRRQGYSVGLLDPGPLPHPLAASTDISKVIRMEYGTDDQYMAMVDTAIDGWRRWNNEFGETLYHQVGITSLARQPLKPGDYELESFQRLVARGHAPMRLNAAQIQSRFPAWQEGYYVDGFFNPRAGYAESGRVISALLQQAQQLGVTLYEDALVTNLVINHAQVTAAETAAGEVYRAGHVVVAAGAWTPYLVPDLQPFMTASGHPVFHLQANQPELFTPPDFSVFTADITHTGWYGFPLHPHENVIKIANHGVGQQLHPTIDERVVTAADEANLRQFLNEALPSLADAPIVYTRRCLYNDTRDEHLWIDQHPTLTGLTVAAGGSGHGFKFGPVLGPLIAAAATGTAHEWLAKFRWRDIRGASGEEAARYHEH